MIKERFPAFAVVIGIVLIAIGSTGLSVKSRVRGQQPQGSLHERAKQNGGKLAAKIRTDRSVIYPNIEELAKRSELIVVGRTLSHRSHLTADGTSITTDFWVLPLDFVKGQIKRGELVLASLPGGAHKFSDGTAALLKAITYNEAQNGKTYVFFLKGIDASSKGHELVGGAQGQFELDLTTGEVEPADTDSSDPVVIKYKGKPAKEFLAEIHSFVGKHQ